MTDYTGKPPPPPVLTWDKCKAIPVDLGMQTLYTFFLYGPVVLHDTEIEINYRVHALLMALFTHLKPLKT